MESSARITPKVVRSVILLVLISRILLLFTGYIGMNLFNKFSTPPVYEKNVPGTVTPWIQKLPQGLEETKLFHIEDFIRLDTYPYLEIATQGYDKVHIDKPHTAANWVFFPMYPLLIYLVNLVFSTKPALIGILLSNLFLVAALIYVYGIALQKGLTDKQAGTMLILILIYPSSVFFTVPYTESLFLLLSAASLYHATNRQYALAFMAAGLSTVTRVPGFINLAFVMSSFVLDEGFRYSKRYWKLALYSALSLLPMAAYLLYMKSITGDFMAPFHEQSLNWYRYSSYPFQNYIHYFQKPYFSSEAGWDNGLIAFTMSTAVFVIYLGYLVFHLKRVGRDLRELLFYVYGAGLIILPFSSQPEMLASVIRYMMVCIPFYIYLVRLSEGRDKLLLFYQMLFMILNVIITIGYFNGFYFVA
ncbi:mannosyltransferase family protein [Paenibacillus sp. GP183]|uniref:mannosyltransferase family protein n=1 Tax=Paenibacillus sp. GP183 TaxID=1882751 RepID=UPI000897ADDD|nr:mannosyltransferase family protein [Paenibacillus sp. GP183]SEC05188.1 Mannosyltransferase related to Gpi18 [Paenibacillus sp. GP183]